MAREEWSGTGGAQSRGGRLDVVLVMVSPSVVETLSA
jgi:hypothetical protein